MNTNEIARLAAAVNMLRPEWPAESLQTFLSRNLGTRPWRDVSCALVFVACDPETKTPARVLERGPWWKLGNDDVEPTRARHCKRCSEFHLPAHECRPARATGKHADHIKAAREIVRDVKATLCRHGVMPWLCADCTKADRQASKPTTTEPKENLL